MMRFHMQEEQEDKSEDSFVLIQTLDKKFHKYSTESSTLENFPMQMNSVCNELLVVYLTGKQAVFALAGLKLFLGGHLISNECTSLFA